MIALQAAVNVAEFDGSVASFVPFPPGTAVTEISAQPANAIEHAITRPKLSRFRAGAQAVLASADGRPIVSHMPRVSLMVARQKRLWGKRSPHLAFTFNFTDLPHGWGYRKTWRPLEDVSRFAVFSAFERELYSEHFKLPKERFERLLWAQNPPQVAARNDFAKLGTYISAVGGEGRDHTTLMRAAAALPHIPFIVVCRPHNPLPEIPSNVTVRTNLDGPTTWRIVKDSAASVVPLRSADTCCGHITIVGSELLGVPVIATRSAATAEYTEDTLLCEPGDHRALAELVEEGFKSSELLRQRFVAAIPSKIRKYDRDAWRRSIAAFLSDPLESLSP